MLFLRSSGHVRDLKPENILLVGRENDVDVKITDFGLAKRANKEGLKTFCGTPQYFAPEVLKRRNTVLGVGRYGKEADMWSVGEAVVRLERKYVANGLHRAMYTFESAIF